MTITHKKCPRCNNILLIDHFSLDSCAASGYRSYCKACIRDYTKSRYLRMGDQLKAYKKDRYYKDIEKSRAKARIKYQAHAEEYRLMARKSYLKQRLAILNHYSNNNPHCVCCGEHEIDFLCLDHKNNDGAKHRKDFKLHGGTGIYRWIRRNNYPDTFQILCHNCNMSRAFYGSCPHKRINISDVNSLLDD